MSDPLFHSMSEERRIRTMMDAKTDDELRAYIAAKERALSAGDTHPSFVTISRAIVALAKTILKERESD